MIISIHQPQFLPWLGYFDKIYKSDAFVFLDNAQYKKNEYQNRNKIRSKNGTFWLTVPVIIKNRFGQKINEVEINNLVDWKRKHIESIKQNYNKAKHFLEYKFFIDELYSKKWNKLVDINTFTVLSILKILGIERQIYFELQLNITESKTDRLIEICKKLDADTYLSGIGAREYLEEEKFKNAGIKLVYQEFIHPVYTQVYSGFEENLSIIDLIFNCGKIGTGTFLSPLGG